METMGMVTMEITKTIKLNTIMKKIFLLIALFLCAGLTVQSQTQINQTYGTISLTCSEYTNNVNRIWNVNIGQNKRVKMMYNINTEAGYDKITVYSIDASGAATLLFTKSGRVSGISYSEFPTGKIQVVFTSDASLSCSGGSPTYPQYTGFDLSYDAADDLLSGNYLQNGILSSYGAANMYLQTNGTNRMTILNSNGNVGIGTTSPVNKFDVKGGIGVYGSGDTGSPIIIYNESKTQAGQAKEWKIWNMTGTYGNSLQFWAYDQAGCSGGLCTSRLTLMDNGNVSIAGTTQTEKLLINKPNSISNWNNIWQSGFYDSYNASFAPESSGWFWGINMNHTSNSSTYRYGGQIVIRNSPATPTMYFRSVDVNGSGTWAKILHSVGNQEINGTLRAKEVKIDINAGADFVFAPGYNLKPLSDVESFIHTNRHLPEIPSEKAMQEDGLSINEFQIKLLQKIEELTLYAIEQNKTIIDQSNAIEELKKEVKELKETK